MWLHLGFWQSCDCDLLEKACLLFSLLTVMYLKVNSLGFRSLRGDRGGLFLEARFEARTRLLAPRVLALLLVAYCLLLIALCSMLWPSGEPQNATAQARLHSPILDVISLTHCQ